MEIDQNGPAENCSICDSQPRIMTWYLYSDEWEENERSLHICIDCLQSTLRTSGHHDVFNQLWKEIVGKVYPEHVDRIEKKESSKFT
jgi:hypothetical protein